MYEIVKTLIGLGVSSMSATGAVAICDHIAEPVVDDKNCSEYDRVCIVVLEIVGSAVIGAVCGSACMSILDNIKSIF